MRATLRLLPILAVLAGCPSMDDPAATLGTTSAAAQCIEATQLVSEMPVRTDAADAAVGITTRYCEPPRELTPTEQHELALAVATLRAEVERLR